jgi:ribosomal protein RSM22 (predicted rRNA methylase)
MALPAKLQAAIEAELGQLDWRSLSRSVADLTESYRQAPASLLLAAPAHRAAYLAVRLPATYAACRHIFSSVAGLAPTLDLRSLLDLGAGPGTASWAASEVLTSIETFSLVERDAELVALGKRLAATSAHPAICDARWIHQQLPPPEPFPPHDLVVLSYCLGELPERPAHTLLSSAWGAARKLLVIVEPGTRRGFQIVRGARDFLIGSGAFLLAPCPHHAACPMWMAGDWCHFAQRVERTSLHRRLKQGELGHEDEKFCYLVSAKSAINPPSARILRHPMKHSGHVQLLLCTAAGLERPTIGKAQGERYRRARRAQWGDP